MKNLSLTLCLAIVALFGGVGSGFAGSDLPPCPSSGYKNNCFGTNVFNGGDKYVGEYKDGKTHGQGTKTWGSDSEFSGDRYVGEFKNDAFNGQGIYTWSDGDKYVGEWQNDKINGQGILTYADGSVQEGIWKDHKFQYAKKLSPPVPVAKTPSQDDVIISASSASYLPPCSSLPFHNCFGTYSWEDKTQYIGEWKNNKLHGKGTKTWGPNTEWAGDKYVGEFIDDELNGRGTYTFANGNKYVGDVRDQKRQGQGTFNWANGDKYVGEFRDDKFNGKGTYTYAGGDKYVGEWKDDKNNGQGIYTFADGTVEEGIWKDGEFQYAKKLSPPVPVAKTPTQDDEIISASSGSGFAVSSDGYVITNHHVIEGCQKVVVHTKEKDLTVRVITYDPQNDLALLKGDFRPSTVFPLSSNRPELLQDIYVAGYPFGNKISTSVKVTRGIISSLTGIGNNFSNIQIDAALQSGNSGGPILDDFGNVIGVAVSKLDAKYMFEEFGIIPENTNFGIKSSVVRSVLDSNEVDSPPANQSEISKSKLGKMISSGTYYISCWMTMAQIEKMKTKKVFFSNLD